MKSVGSLGSLGPPPWGPKLWTPEPWGGAPPYNVARPLGSRFTRQLLADFFFIEFNYLESSFPFKFCNVTLFVLGASNWRRMAYGLVVVVGESRVCAFSVER